MASVTQNGQDVKSCHRIVSNDEADRLQREAWDRMDAAGAPASPERFRVAYEVVQERGLIRRGDRFSLLVKIGGEETYQHGGYCEICDGGEWPKLKGEPEISPNGSHAVVIDSEIDCVRKPILPSQNRR